MIFKIHLLYPFDLGAEFNFSAESGKTFKKELRLGEKPLLSYGGKVFRDVEITAEVFSFGSCVIDISFSDETEYDFLANLSSNCENIKADKGTLIEYCETLARGVEERVRGFRKKEYSTRLKTRELFPVFIQAGEMHYHTDKFLEKNLNAILGIIGGENRYDKLSPFILNSEAPQNIGYYSDEIILVKRYGALIHSSGWANIMDLIKLCVAQYWGLKSYDLYFNSEITTAREYLDDIPPYYRVVKIFKKYNRFSTDAIDFDIDKLSITHSLYTLSPFEVEIEPDWHMITVYKSIRNAFGMEELYRNLEVKIDRLENSYSNAREFLSTNFFILLDLIFFLSLVWSILDTVLLFIMATK